MKEIFTDFVQPLFKLPLWIKQYIFINLKREFTSKLECEDALLEFDFLYINYVPELTFKGKEELNSRALHLQPNFYRFLSDVQSDKSVIEITINNYWTLEESSKFFAFALEAELIKEVKNDIILSTAFYMASKIRIGEYFKKIGKINVDQLNHVLRKIKEYSETGNTKKTGEILIELNYVTKKDMAAILYIKDESKKRFVLDVGELEVKETKDENKDYSQIENELASVKNECNLLKNKLHQIYA